MCDHFQLDVFEITPATTEVAFGCHKSSPYDDAPSLSLSDPSLLIDISIDQSGWMNQEDHCRWSFDHRREKISSRYLFEQNNQKIIFLVQSLILPKSKLPVSDIKVEHELWKKHTLSLHLRPVEIKKCFGIKQVKYINWQKALNPPAPLYTTNGRFLNVQINWINVSQ